MDELTELNTEDDLGGFLVPEHLVPWLLEQQNQLKESLDMEAGRIDSREESV